MALPDTTTIALAVVRGPNGGDTIATQTSQPGVGGMEYCVTLRKVDHRPCTCCDKPLLGPKDRIHSFCDKACFISYFAGSYKFPLTNTVRKLLNADGQPNTSRGRFCRTSACDPSDDAFDNQGLTGYSARLVPTWARYY